MTMPYSSCRAESKGAKDNHQTVPFVKLSTPSLQLCLLGPVTLDNKGGVIIDHLPGQSVCWSFLL